MVRPKVGDMGTIGDFARGNGLNEMGMAESAVTLRAGENVGDALVDRNVLTLPTLAS